MLTHLSKCALHATKEVSLLQPIVVTANVMDFKAQALHLFKVEVHSKQLGVHWVYAGADHFCPVNLKRVRKRRLIRTFYKWGGLLASSKPGMLSMKQVGNSKVYKAIPSEREVRVKRKLSLGIIKNVKLPV